ncbi:large adhesin [Chlorella sorokiniana]|uniref:Large adhesin n=1 Tax=Chlorella sorokiniana TaxID=3076 RepID=A0A2P6TMS5_CHLSO|nr:large adhesin [Chlorella sorokiniana]|eukprot:PRW45632.1 large adhesin [Chlorella sorokiniana]
MEEPDRAAALDSSEQAAWLPGELFLQRVGSPLKPANGDSPAKAGSSPLKSPLKGGGGRRLSTASGRRLSTFSARSLPESHPVSPCSDRGEASSDGADASSSPQPPPTERDHGGSIPAYRGASPASPPAHAGPAAEERVTLNLFVQEDGAAAAAELEQAQAELAALRLHVQHLEAAAAAAQPAAEQAAAAAEQDQQQAELVQLVLNVVEQPQAAAAAAPQQDAQPPAEPVQLVLNIVEQAPSAPGEAEAAASTLAAQLQRAEACREELARQAGQLRGRIAKLEGAVQAGEGRVRAQAAELEATKARARDVEAQLQAAQAQVGVTPERARAERRRLAEQAEQAEAEAQAVKLRVQRLEAVLAFEARHRDELCEFAAEEHQVLTSAEASLAAEAARWKAEAAAAAAQLGEARQRLVDTDAALLQRDEEVSQLREELEAAQGAAAQAAELTAEWRGRADAFDRDRQAAASNIRKAERELELVAQDNERLFRQLNFVRARLIGQLPNLDAAVPDIGKLARELQSWCDREAVQRARWLVNPNQRSARGIAHVLQAPPAPGRLGLARDTMRLFLAARGITLVFLVVTMPLPLWMHVLASLYAIQRVRTTADLCDSVMLKAPAWVQRISTTHEAARGLPLLLERAALPSLAGCPPEARCRMFVAFYQYALATASILVAAKLHPLLYGTRSSEAGSSRPSAARRLLHSALRAADARLHHLCALLWGEQGSLLARLVAAWTLLSFLWQLALLVEGHAPLPPTAQPGGA